MNEKNYRKKLTAVFFRKVRKVSSKQLDEKTIRHLIACIKQQKEEKGIAKIDWVCSQEQLADVFTKKNAKTNAILTGMK